MVVTHSPGNPFAFSPATTRGPSFTDADAFQYYKSPSVHASPAVRRPSFEFSQRSAYAQKEYEENVAQERLLKDARIEELEKRSIEDAKVLERAESDKRWLFEKEQKQALEITSLKEEIINAKKNADASMKDLRISYSKLRDAHLTLEDQQRADEQTRGREMERMASDNENQRRALSALRADLAGKSDMLAEKNQHIEDLERRLDEQNATKLSGTPEDLAFVTKELAAAISKVTNLETTVTTQIAKIHRLQEANAHIPVLKEEKATLERKVKSIEGYAEQLAEAQVRIAEFEKEKSAWTELLGDGDMTDISSVLTRQKNNLDSLAAQKQLLEEQLDDSNTIIATTRQELSTQVAKLDELTSKLEAEQRVTARLERSKALGAREIHFLREQLKSYDLEEQVESPNYDALKAARISELESTVDQLRAQFDKKDDTALDTNVKINLGTKRVRDETNDFNEIERGEYLRKIRALNADLEITRKEDALLRKELDALKTSTASSSVRILQYKQNPTSQYQAVRSQTLHDLKVENESLLSQLSGAGIVTVPIQTLRNTETELRKTLDTIKQKEKMIQRLKEVFSAKSSEFREAVYSLLGYKLDFLPNGRVRLTSMYGAEQHDHAFVFDGEAGTMQLSGERHGNEQFMDTVGNLIKYWSGERNSIPGMLSALTLELLDKAPQSEQQSAQ